MSDLNTLVSYLFEGSVNVEDASVKSESIKAGELPNTADQYQIDKEMVHHPEHYQGCCMEVMDVLENFFTEEEVKGFCKGNAIKYILRKKDNPEQDLMKARQYLNYLIDGEF